MRYKVDVKRSAEKRLDSIDKKTVGKILLKIAGLRDDPLHAGVEKLRQGPGYRIRVGKYRIIYDIDFKKRLVYITKIGSRDKAYR